MRYVIEYELSALVFLIFITARFFEKRHFPNKQNTLFGVILVCAIIDVSLDIISSLLIENVAVVPRLVILVVNSIFYSMQMFASVLFLIYVLSMVGQLTRANIKYIGILLIPALFFQLLLVINPFTHDVFYVDDAINYIHGNWFLYLYICSFIYLVATFIIIYKYKLKIQNTQYHTILSIIFVITVTIGLQYFYPQYLLTGVGLVLSITIMYFTMQNPEDMLDVMTGLFNYSALLLFLRDRVNEKKQFQLIALDIKHLQRINPFAGLRDGNGVMHSLGTLLQGDRRKTWSFQLSGTRFMAITYEQDDYLAMLELLRQRFNQTWLVEGVEIMLPAKICHFSHVDFGEKPEDIINLIDMVFDEMESSDQPCTITEVNDMLLTGICRSMAVEEVLRASLTDRSGFELYFQPIYSLAENRFTMAEALLRFSHPQLGSIPPWEFIPIAEKAGLILQIDKLVIEMVCEFIHQYQPHTLLSLDRLEVNLSAMEFFHPNFAERLRGMVENQGFPPGFLLFEVTETAATASYDILNRTMHSLKEYGFRFVLDDFGIGYANISQVVNLPFCAVKLDRSLLMPDIDGQNNFIPLKYILNMFKQLGMITVAEGVETKEQADFIKELGADYIQGYYYAYPMPAEEFVDFILKSAN